MAIMKSIIPPAIPSDYSSICNICSMNLPTNMKNNRIIKAIINSRMMMGLLLLIGMFLRILRKTGTFPIGSIMITNNKIAANTVTKVT